MKIKIPQYIGHFSIKYLGIGILFLITTPMMGQKKTVNKDSIAARDSIREYMFHAALLSMDALQAKYESQKTTDAGIRQQKSGEAQNLFFQSRAYYRKAIKTDGNYFQAWANMGTTYYLQDLPKEAVHCYRKTLAINPDYSPAWFYLGKTYVMLSKGDSAEFAFRKSIQTDSTNMQSYQELSRLVMTREKDTSIALDLLRLSAFYSPLSEVPWVSMSRVYFDSKDSANGVTALEKAAAIYSGDIYRLQFLSGYFQRHADSKKSLYYLNLIAVQKKKQEIPTDKDPD